MDNLKTSANGSAEFLNDFRNFLEDRNETGEQHPVEFDEQTNVGTGKQAGVVILIGLILHLAAELMKGVVTDYLKDVFKRTKHSASYQLKNAEGETLTVTLNGLTIEEVEQKIKEFRGDITEFSDKTGRPAA